MANTRIEAKYLSMMEDNQEYLKSMLNFAIEQLESIAENDEIYLMDQGRVCKDYESIFNCLKHWSMEK